MQPEAVVVLVELDEPREELEPIVGNVAYMPPEHRARRARRLRARGSSPATRAGARASSRRSSRSRRGSSRRAEPEDVFAADPDELWRDGAPAQGRQVRADRDDAVRPDAELSCQPTARLETFADGVFAIAATLLIIDVSVQAPGDELGRALLHAWPSTPPTRSRS